MLPYEREFRFTTQGANEIVPLAYPSRSVLKRVAGVNEGGNVFTLNLYNRAFSSAAIAIDQLLGDDNDKLILRLESRPSLIKKGDQVTVANTTGGTQDGTHRVEEIFTRDPLTNRPQSVIVTDTTVAAGFSDAGGDVQLFVPSAERNMYKVTPNLQSANDGSLLSFVQQEGGELIFYNLDRWDRSGNQRHIYAQPDVAGTYRLIISSHIMVD